MTGSYSAIAPVRKQRFWCAKPDSNLEQHGSGYAPRIMPAQRQLHSMRALVYSNHCRHRKVHTRALIRSWPLQNPGADGGGAAVARATRSTRGAGEGGPIPLL